VNDFNTWWTVKKHLGHDKYGPLTTHQAAKAAWDEAAKQSSDELARLRAENAELRADAERWMNLLRGYRKAVGDVAPYFDKPLTDSNMVFWVNLNNAGATVNAAIDAARKEEQ
jgi:hypothetical protein